MSYNRQQLVIENFGGVDLSSSPLLVNSARASYMRNLINDNGVNHKRPGWRQELNFAAEINGIYEYENGDYKVLIVYAGTTFYEVNGDSKKTLYSQNNNSGLKNQRVQFFRQRERLYIIGCGDYLVYGTWNEGESYELKRVVDTDVYVPTVLTGAQSVHITDSGEGVVGSPGTVLEAKNYFTCRIKKKFIGADNTKYEINLGENCDISSGVNITVETTDKTYMLSVNKTANDNGRYLINRKYNTQDAYETDIGHIKISSLNIICFEINTKPPGAEYSNITIEYTPEGSTLVTTAIAKCTFGTLFGAYGRADRLFLSGNPDMKNVDFYSGFEDFTYFPTNSRTEMGSDDAAITGYLRLSDSTLATFKEGFGNEPTVYYRKATEVDDNGATDVAFTRVDGSVGESCISPYCTANLAGDDIMLSENGLFGIVIPENLNNNDRYFRERDRFINTALRNGKLSDSVGIVYKNRYYLSTGDGICYVADPRFKSYLSNDIDNSFNYEWWVWDNIPARVFAIIGGELYFGTSDGKICVFDGAFTDRTYEYSSEGDVTLRIIDNNVTFSTNANWVKNGQQITLLDAINENNTLYIVNVTTDTDGDGGTFQLALSPECSCDICSSEDDGVSDVVTINDYFATIPDSLSVRINYPKNVVSSWYTPVFSLGATDISKTLLSMSVTLDPRIRGSVSFGYETKNVQRLLGARSGAFSFENFSFDDFSFDSGFTSSYTVKVKERHFNYVMFKFISDTNTDCAVCNFKATYIYNGRHRGIR